MDTNTVPRHLAQSTAKSANSSTKTSSKSVFRRHKVLLDGSDLLRTLRIKTFFLLGSAVEDRNGTEACRSEAEMHWSLARCFHTEGEDPIVERSLAELLAGLDHLGRAQSERRPAYEVEDDVAGVGADDEMFDEGTNRLMDAEAVSEAEGNDPKALLLADREAISGTADDKLKLTEAAASSAGGKEEGGVERGGKSAQALNSCCSSSPSTSIDARLISINSLMLELKVPGATKDPENIIIK